MMFCPVCHREDAHILRTLCQNAQVLGDCFPPAEIQAADCPHCGMTYLRSALTQADYTQYYRQIAKSPRYYELFGREGSDDYFEHIYQRLKKYLPAGRAEVLDVAGSWGEMGAYLEKADEDLRVTVLDVNDNCLRACEDKGLATVDADIAAPMDGGAWGTYNVVIANHTLEHILDLRTAMHNIHRLIRGGGGTLCGAPRRVTVF